MRYVFILVLLSCTYTIFGQTTVKLENDDKKEIRYQARRKIEHDLKDLLNTLSFEEVGDADRKDLIRNSYLPGPNQLFYDDEVVIEDDINPERFDFTNIRDAGVAEYLNNLDLFYEKTAEPSIAISNIVVAPEVQIGEYPFIKVYFTSQFKGKHLKIQSPYKATQRIAELRAVLKGKKWQVYITRLAFFNPGKEQTTTGVKEVPSAQPVDPALTALKKEINKPVVSLQQKRTRWLLLTSVALAGTAATFISLNSSYSKYKTRVETYNSDFGVWKSLSRDPSLGKPLEQMSFFKFSEPGIFAVYGGTAFTLFSLRNTLIKHKKIKQSKSVH